MNKTLFGILVLSFSYLLIFLYAYGVFWQQPVVEGLPFTVQQLVEPLFYYAALLFGLLFLFNSIYKARKVRKIVDESKLLIPSIVLVHLSGFGYGIHAAAQMIEDFLGKTSGNFIYGIAFFLDEYPGHLLVSIPSYILFYFLFLLEINRGETKLRLWEKLILVVLSVVSGLLGVIGGFEGGSQYIAEWPLVIFLLYLIFKLRKRVGFNLWNYPFTYYFVISMLVFAVVTPLAVLKYGATIQPEADLGWRIDLQLK